jgi:hypothetical protein
MSIILKATITFAVVPDGAQQQNVSVAQSLTKTNDLGGMGGYVYLVNDPTGANIDTAVNSLATNIKAFFDNGAPLAQIQRRLTAR